MEEDFVIVIQQGEGAIAFRAKCQLLAQVSIRHFQLEDIEFFSTPSEAVETEQWRGHLVFTHWLKAPAQKMANQREIVRLNNNIELQVLHSLAQNRPRFKQLNFSHCRRSPAEHLTHFPHAAQRSHAAFFLFNLNQRIRLVNRRRQHGIRNTHRAKERSDANNDPLAIDQGAEECEQIDVVIVVAVFLDGEAVWALHAGYFYKR
ncbi:hypothetical protein D3C85_1109610 [compost metagenome]